MAGGTGGYRGFGADLPYGRPERAHGVAMEGYFWRFTRRDIGTVVIALAGVNRDRRGESWSTLGVATHPGATQVMVEHSAGWADPAGLGVRAGTAFEGTDELVRVRLGERARLDVRVDGLRRFPRGLRRPFGGSSVFQCVPGLNQYWHPWALGGTAHGTAMVDGVAVSLDGAEVYAEKNWGREGFPDAWWWGQAQGFGDGGCVAFAGGRITVGPLATEVTGLVVALPDGPVIRLGDPVISPVRARVTDDTWELAGRGFGWTVDVRAQAPLAAAHVLPVPLPSTRRNVAGALEHLGGRLAIDVRRGRRTVWSGESDLAGLEHGGLARAAAELTRRGASPDAYAAPPVPSRGSDGSRDSGGGAA